MLGVDVFERRRRRFMQAMGDGSAAIFPAATERIRSNDVEYRFRQHSDFHYLTGFPEPGAVCLLLPGHHKEEYVLFVRPRDDEREAWSGRRAGVDGAIDRFGAAGAYPIEKLDDMLPQYLAERERVYYVMDHGDAFTPRVMRWLEQAQAKRQRTGSGPTALLDAREVLHEMRLRKEPEELNCMRRAAEITAAAHLSAMREACPGHHEYEIEALMEYTFRRAGADGPAYPSIVASGPNAAILHYTNNNCVMQSSDSLLIDAGAEYECYCADVTRSFPLGARFEGRHRAIYEVVLEAQLTAIATVRPGVRIDEIHQRAVRVLVEGLVSLGLLNGSVTEIEEKELYKPLYLHRTSHWLGLDVHDVGLYKVAGQSRALEPGMVLTVEPGVYIGEHLADVASEWHGLGVRIEDDVVVTSDGYEVLSAAIPKRIDEIEALRRDGLPATGGL